MQIKNQSDIRQLGKIMGVWAHPDDETFSSCGIMASAIVNGQEVICVTATKGEKGVQDESRWPANRLAQTRAAEQEAVLKITGVKNYHWLNFEDGHCKDFDEEGTEHIVKLIEKYSPDTILTFGNDGFTGHEDHIAMHRWVNSALKLTSYQPAVYNVVCTEGQYKDYLQALDKKLNIFFNLGEPKLINELDCDINFKLSPKLGELKYQAILAMPSQTLGMTQLFDKKTLINAYSAEAFKKQ